MLKNMNGISSYVLAIYEFNRRQIIRNTFESTSNFAKIDIEYGKLIILLDSEVLKKNMLNNILVFIDSYTNVTYTRVSRLFWFFFCKIAINVI